MKEYNYEEWLSGHANRKSMMEKLERSLIPYDLFACIPLANNREDLDGDVVLGPNTYHYKVSYDYNCFGHEVYDAVITATDIKDLWQNALMGYNRFKVVMEGDRILTIYSDHEDFFQQIIDMFEHNDMSGLYANRSAYVNNVLARYILLRLIESHFPELQLLTSLATEEDGKISVMAASANRTKVIMYAFGKREALQMAHRYDGIARDLLIVYFFNQDFEQDGNTVGYDSGGTHVCSIRRFYNSLPVSTIEKRLIEQRVLLLVSLLHNEHLEWGFGRIERVAINPPYFGKRAQQYKKSVSSHKNTGRKNRAKGNGKPWWERISRTLLEDALNVLSEIPSTHADLFHYLCASNMVNAYVNQCNQGRMLSQKQIQRMYQAKQQIFRCFEELAAKENRNIKMSLNRMPSILVNIRVEGQSYQFSFRGMSDKTIASLISSGIPTDGTFEGYSMQTISTALYQYSYLLRWKSIVPVDSHDGEVNGQKSQS